MLRKIYASILSLFAIAASMPANAWEWREFSKTDFGGNDEASRIICEVQNEENAIETDLTFYPWNRNYTPGSYMIIKATQLADVGGGFNLTNWGEALSGAPRWASGGDHTNPDDPNKGYFMAFDCPSKLKVQLYKQELPVAGSGVKFKLEAYFAVLDWRNVASNDVEIAIESEGKTLAKASLNSESNSDWKAVSQNFKWVPLSLEASVDDPSITSVDFVVNAINCEPAGWDFGLDDITISVEQPKITYKNETYKYQKPATLKVTYDESEFDDFFKNSSNVKYQWYKDDGTGNFVALSEAGGAYTSGKDLSLTIPSFDKNVDNGKYRLVVAPGDNFGDGNNQNLCAIQKDIVIDQFNEVDGGEIHMDTLICKDQILFGVEYTEAGDYTVVRPGATESGCTLDTVWRIKVMDVSLKIRAFNNNYEICEGQSVSLQVTLRAFDSEGKGLHTEYHWEPEVPDNSLNPTLYLDQTTEYTFYADFSLSSDADKNAKGCHVKESFTINVHKSPKLTIDSIDSQNGNVEVSIKEGTAPYQIFVDINPISSTDDNLVMIEKLNIGTHVLQVVDSVGCSSEEVIEIKGTAVDDILADPSSNDDNYYNVNGQKVVSPEKGKVYINNGKKIMYK